MLIATSLSPTASGTASTRIGSGRRCKQCHVALWEAAKKEGGRLKIRPGFCGTQIESQKRSVHAAKDKDDPSKTNAICADCHDSHAVVRNCRARHAPRSGDWGGPARRGTCHEEHPGGLFRLRARQGRAGRTRKVAICTDCHNPMGVDRTSTDEAKKGIGRVQAIATRKTPSRTATRITGDHHAGLHQDSDVLQLPRQPRFAFAERPKSKVQFRTSRLKFRRSCLQRRTAGFATTSRMVTRTTQALPANPVNQLHGGPGWERLPSSGSTSSFGCTVKCRIARRGVTRPGGGHDQLQIPPGKQFQRFRPVVDWDTCCLPSA